MLTKCLTLCENGLLGVSHCPIIKKRPALVRWSSGSVAGSVDAKVQLFLGMTKLFERKLLLCGHAHEVSDTL